MIYLTLVNLSDRYLIVIDDIWDEDAWGTISHALFKNNLGSITITTTRSHDIAKKCCSSDGDILYNMKPLDSVAAERLFFERLFGSEDKCPAHLVDVSYKILDKCGGVPLAIISISGLLASKPQTVDEWDRVHNSIGHGLEKSRDVDRMMQILSLSYFDLPYHLKTCLLYISVFPEDSVIDKRRLIRRWIAEGFIQEEHGHTRYDLGERCFNELINRNLIQGRDLNIYDEVTACQVHDTILDIIISKSEEENFVTVVDDGYRVLGEHSKVRRLSPQAKGQDKVSTLALLDLSHVRSVTMFNDSVETLWSKFRFLRVLDLDDCKQVDNYHLADIGNLFQLKYLGLRGTQVWELPEQIGKLQYLVYLAVDEEVELLPGGVGSMAALEELHCVGILNQSVDFTRELGQLKNLRNIQFFLGTNSSIAAAGSHYEEYIYNMLLSLSKLDRLQSMSFYIERKCKEDFCLDSEGCAPGGLRRLEIMRWYIPKVPNWVRDLINLQQLILHVKELHVADILVLGRLPALEFLRLVVQQSFQGRRITIRGSDGFQNLKQFDFGYAIPVMFDVGAMPNLETLNLKFSIDSLKIDMLVVSNNGDFPFGIQHLSSLRSIHTLVGWGKKSIDDWINEMIIQLEKKGFIQRGVLANRIMTLISATVSLMEAKLRQGPSGGKPCAVERATLSHSYKDRGIWDESVDFLTWGLHMSMHLLKLLRCQFTPMVLARGTYTIIL
jgi:hypothetical protein